MEFINKFPVVSDLYITDLDLSMDLLNLAKFFFRDKGTVLLLSGGNHDCSNYHILGIKPWIEIRTKARNINIKLYNKEFSFVNDPFYVLKNIIHHFKIDKNRYELDLPILYGLLGYLSYDLKDQIEYIPSLAVDDLYLPDIVMYCPEYLFVENVNTGKIWIVMPVIEGDKKQCEKKLDNLLNLSDSFSEDMAYYTNSKIISNFERDEYLDSVQKIKDYIIDGDVYQVNLSQRFEGEFYGDPYGVFMDLFRLNPAPFFGYINAGDHQIISTSPERFLYQNGDYVETRPIKGTRPRGKNLREDKLFLCELENSKKDDAELSMIVDLLRNDIGKVCIASSVKVKEHKRVEAYNNVYHLISIITGKLSPDMDSIDLIRAAFPGGSITGCPKIRAMEIIEELEPNKRHIYTGSIGYISFHDTMDLSIAIRTATVIGNRIIFSVGGGIVYDSDPVMEFEETLHKGKSFFDVLKIRSRRKKGEDNTWVWVNGKFIHGDRVNFSLFSPAIQYGMGIFETIRVEQGEIYFLSSHIDRLKKSWNCFTQLPLPHIDFDVVIRELINKNGLKDKVAAVKIIAGIGQRNLPPYDIILCVITSKYVPRIDFRNRYGLKVGIYSHKRLSPIANFKTLNYMYYFEAKKWAQKKGFDEAIILNPDGSISEGNSTNIILIQKDIIYIPESEYFLKGVMLTKTLDFLKKKGFKIVSKKLYPQDMFEVDEVILTNSLIGAMEVESVDGRGLQVVDSPLSYQINDHFFKWWR